MSDDSAEHKDFNDKCTHRHLLVIKQKCKNLDNEQQAHNSRTGHVSKQFRKFSLCSDDMFSGEKFGT